MKLESITITAEASKAYQKYCASFTATDLHDGDLETLRNLAIMESIKGINLLANETSDKPEVKVAVNRDEVKRSSYPVKDTKRPTMYIKEPKVGDLKEFNGQVYKLCFNRNNNEWFYSNQGNITKECPKYIKYED